MKKLFLGITIGVLTTIGILTIFNYFPLKSKDQVAILASSNTTKYIEANYNIDKILVDGVDTGIANSSFVSSGVTYIPLRAIGEILNSSINWDQDTKTISITSNTSSNILNNSTENINNYNSSNTTGESFIGLESAKQIALEKTNGGTIISYKEELSSFFPKYSFKIYNNYTEYDININAKTGDIIKFEQEYEYNPALNNFDTLSNISDDEAKAIALEKVGGGQIIKFEKDLDDYILEYKIKVLKDNLVYEIEINGGTGAVIKFELD